jgi:DNA-binding transcriptional MocR family regulator
MHRRDLAYRHKRGIVQEVLRGLGPRFRVDGLDAAGTVVLRLPAGPDAAAVARALDDRGVRVHPEGARTLLLGYGHLPDAELRNALDVLVRALWAILTPSQDLVAA